MKHWTEKDFKHWLYGLKEPDEHFDTCADCRAESERLLRLRRRITADAPVAPEFLAAQRRRIYERLDAPWHRAVSARWFASVAAMVLLVVLSISYFRPRPTVPLYTHSDEQLFSDLSRIENSEPRAIQPIHNLFEE